MPHPFSLPCIQKTCKLSWYNLNLTTRQHRKWPEEPLQKQNNKPKKEHKDNNYVQLIDLIFRAPSQAGGKKKKITVIYNKLDQIKAKYGRVASLSLPCHQEAKIKTQVQMLFGGLQLPSPRKWPGADVLGRLVSTPKKI